MTASQVQTQTIATPPPGKDTNQQPSSMSQPLAVVQAAVPTAEQWYQQQQQYQQYYQQYPGYNPYQQHYQQYYPYQQQALPQYQQPQAQSQSQMQPQAQVHPSAQFQSQLQPSHPPVQATVAAQPQNQAQVNQQQQSHPLHHGQLLSQAQSYPQAQPQSYPQSQPPQPQPIQPHLQHMQLPQYQQPQSQILHTPPQIQHPVPQPQPQPQPQSNPQSLQTQVQHQSQPQSHHPPHPSHRPQAQQTAASAVTSHHSYSQPQPHQQIPLSGPLQHPMYVHPHTGAQSQMQNQFPQQTPSMRPAQSHATISNQPLSTGLPPLGQVANIPPAQQLPVRPHAPQPGVPVSQHPVMQPVQQPMPYQYVQQHLPFSGQHQQGPFVQPQLRPQRPPQSLQLHPPAYSQPLQNVAVINGMQSHQPRNLGQPLTPNYGVHAQSYQQSATSLHVRPAQLGANQSSSNQSNLSWTSNQVQLSSEQQAGATSKPEMSEKNEVAVKIAHEREAESSSEKTAKTDNFDTPGPEAAAVGMKVPKSETDVKAAVDEIKTEVEDKTNVVDTSSKEFVTDRESHIAENVQPINKMVKEEVIENVEGQKDSANVDIKQEEHSVSKEVQEEPLLKTSTMQQGTQFGEQSEKVQKEQKVPQAQGAQGPGAVPPAGQAQAGGFVQSPPSLYGSSTLQQRPAAPSIFQAPPPGAVPQTQAPTQFRPPMFKPEVPPGGIPVSGPAASFGRGPGHNGPHQHSFESPLVAPQGPYNLGHPHPSPVGGPPQRSVPLSGFDSHVGTMVGPAYGPGGPMDLKQPSNPMEAEMFTGQRPGYMDGRESDSHFPGSQQRSPLGPPSGTRSNMMRMNGGPGSELRDERFKSFPDGRLNPFPVDPARSVIDRGEFEEDLKQFSRPSHLDAEPVPKLGSHFLPSRPFDRGPHGYGMDMGPRPFERGLSYDPGLKLDPMGASAPSRFLPAYHDDAAGRSDSSHAHPDFPRPGRAYGRRHMGGLSPRSPFREFCGFGGLPGSLGGSRSVREDIGGREFRRFGDPIGNSFHDSRFPVLPSHLRRGEFEGPGRTGDLIGQEFLPSHLRRGEPLGPHNLRLGETVGLGGFPGPARMEELGGPGNFPPPRLGEPGFRSSFSRQGFPNDGGFYTVKNTFVISVFLTLRCAAFYI